MHQSYRPERAQEQNLRTEETPPQRRGNPSRTCGRVGLLQAKGASHCDAPPTMTPLPLCSPSHREAPPTAEPLPTAKPLPQRSASHHEAPPTTKHFPPRSASHHKTPPTRSPSHRRAPPTAKPLPPRSLPRSHVRQARAAFGAGDPITCGLNIFPVGQQLLL